MIVVVGGERKRKGKYAMTGNNEQFDSKYANMQDCANFL